MINRFAVMCEIADHYGVEHQTNKAIEELSELTRALARGDRDNFVEELADVDIMLTQLCYLHKIYPEEIIRVENRKLERQLKRIKEEGND